MEKNKKLMNPNAPADFLPPLTRGIGIRPFQYWCQQVLPLVYDDSLSYYELLCKVVDYLDRVIEETNQLGSDIDELHKVFELLQGYVNDYFKNLDVQAEIDAKIDELVTSGYFEGLIEKYIKLYNKTNITLSIINEDSLLLENILGEYYGQFSIQGSCYNKDTGNCMIVCASFDQNKFLAILCKPTFEVVSRRVFEMSGVHPNDITYNPIDKKYYITTNLSGKLARFDYCEATLEVFNIPIPHIVVQISYNDDGEFYLMFDFKVWKTIDFVSFTKVWKLPIATNASVPYDHVRYTSYQASEVINGAFVSILWIYGNDFHDSYCRLYVCTIGEEKVVAYDTVMENTFDEPECFFYDGRAFHLLGYFENILTRSVVVVNDVGVPNNHDVKYENLMSIITDLNQIPHNSMGYLHLNSIVSPINGDFSAPYICIVDGKGTRKSLTVYRTNGEHFTNFCVDGTWLGWKRYNPTFESDLKKFDDIPLNSSGYVTFPANLSPTGRMFSSGYIMFGTKSGNRRFLLVPSLDGSIYTANFNGSEWQYWGVLLPGQLLTVSDFSEIPSNSSGYITLQPNVSPTGGVLQCAYSCSGTIIKNAYGKAILLYRTDGTININVQSSGGWSGWKTIRGV